MPTDDWLIFAYFMIFSSVLLCGLLPIILRLLNARRRFHRDIIERQIIESSYPQAFVTRQSIYSDVQVDMVVFDTIDQSTFQRIDSNQIDLDYAQIPYIDDDTSL